MIFSNAGERANENTMSGDNPNGNELSSNDDEHILE